MLTAAEWLSENSERQELALQNIPLAMEAYARYKSDIESVEFAEWISHNCNDTLQSGMFRYSQGDGKLYTPSQLFELFKIVHILEMVTPQNP